MNHTHIAILGLGLIGGSLAKAFKRKKHSYILYGYDPDSTSLALAAKEGILDYACSSAAVAVKHADLVFISTPVSVIPAIMEEIKDKIKDGTIVTDVGSTKQDVMRMGETLFSGKGIFIGGHPMAGTENSGYRSSLPHLFENAYYVLTPSPTTPASALQALTSILSSIGALPLSMDAALHDTIVGAISHLPHVVASALVNTVKDLEDPDQLKEKLAAGGFRDITRIASSNPGMWTDISLSNRKSLASLIFSMIKNLYQFGMKLEAVDSQGIMSFFEEAREFRQSLPTRQSLSLLPYHELYVDVEDRPGIIGEVATLLGQHDINIKNLRIINSREDEPGCLVLSFADPASLREAAAVLSSKGYPTYKK